MPIAAVPNYLQEQDTEFYLSAPPGHRFLLYFPMWGTDGEARRVDWRTKDRVQKFKRVNGELTFDGWTDIENDQYACTIAACKTPPYFEETPRARRPRTDDGLKRWKPLMEALLCRQRQAFNDFANSAARLSIEAQAVAPFTTGLGNEHPLENGFAFLNPYGLPYLPGSGVKGVLRQAARELASGEWGDTHGWSDNKDIPLMQGNSERHKPVLDSHKLPVMLSMIEVLFGRQTPGGDSDHVRGALSFWDVIPLIKGDSLAVEIMTPHQSHYYQQNRDRRSGDSTTSHDSGQPNPISFLTVPPGSGFVFHVLCDTAHLARLAPELAQADESGKPRWKTPLEAAFAHAFQWLGFGAKTAVGYGAMRRDLEAEKKTAEKKAKIEADALKAREEQERAAQRQAELAQLSPLQREVRELLYARPDKNQSELSALLSALKQGKWQGDDKIEVARIVERMMREAKKWKEKSEKKKPEKDHDYQDTLMVMAWLRGEP